MFTSSNNNNNTILDRQTIRWGDLNFVRPRAEEKPPLIGTLLTSNILKLKITGLDLLGTYSWGIYTQETLLNISATDTGTFTLTGSDTEQDIDIRMVDNVYAPNNTYYFGMRKEGGEEKIQIRFTTGQNLVKATGTDIINSLPGGSVTYNGLEINTTNNKIITEGSLELNDITTFDNTKIPTNLAVQTFVNNAITNFDLDTNTDFTDLKTRVSNVETDKRDISDSYSQTEVDTKDTNTLTSANNYTDGEIVTLSNSVTANLADKEDVANKGVAGGYASLDGAGLVPSSQLPSFVDDILEFANLAGFPATGETGKIYVALDTNKTYRWSGSAYIELKDDTAIWGEVSGTLSNQTDLQSALNTKFDKTGGGITDQTYLRNTVNNANFPALVLNNFVSGGNGANASVSLSSLITQPSYPYTLATASIGSNLITKRTTGVNAQLTVQISNPSLGFESVFRFENTKNTSLVELDLNSQKIINLATPTDSNDGVNKSYVDGLDAQNVKLTGNQTIAGTKTFSSPVVGQDPTASNHLTTRNFVDPENKILNQILTVKNRFATAGLVFDSWKAYKLEEVYKKILAEGKVNDLPDVLLIPELSTDLENNPTSTVLVNLGTSSATFTINNTTATGLIVNNVFAPRTAGANVFVASTFAIGEEDVSYFYNSRNISVTGTDGYCFGNSALGGSSSPRCSSNTLRLARYDQSVVGIYTYTTSTTNYSSFASSYDANIQTFYQYQGQTELLNPSNATLDGDGRATKSTNFESGNIKLFNTITNAESFNSEVRNLMAFKNKLNANQRLNINSLINNL